MVKLGILAGLAIAVAIAAPAVPAAAAPAPATAPGAEALASDAHARAGAAVADSPELTVERARNRIIVGKQVTYRVTVTNRDPDSELTTTVRASVSPRMREVTAPDSDAQLGDGVVSWPVSLAPQESRTLRLSGVYVAAGPEARTDRVTLTACLLTSSGQPFLCATDLAPVATWSGMWWWFAAAVLLAGAVGVLLWRNRHRRLPWDWRQWRRVLPLVVGGRRRSAEPSRRSAEPAGTAGESG